MKRSTIMKKKLIALTASAIMALSLSGCMDFRVYSSEPEKESDVTTSASTTEESEPEVGEEVSEEIWTKEIYNFASVDGSKDFEAISNIHSEKTGYELRGNIKASKGNFDVSFISKENSDSNTEHFHRIYIQPLSGAYQTYESVDATAENEEWFMTDDYLGKGLFLFVPHGILAYYLFDFEQFEYYDNSYHANGIVAHSFADPMGDFTIYDVEYTFRGGKLSSYSFRSEDTEYYCSFRYSEMPEIKAPQIREKSEFMVTSLAWYRYFGEGHSYFYREDEPNWTIHIRDYCPFLDFETTNLTVKITADRLEIYGLFYFETEHYVHIIVDDIYERYNGPIFYDATELYSQYDPNNEHWTIIQKDDIDEFYASLISQEGLYALLGAFDLNIDDFVFNAENDTYEGSGITFNMLFGDDSPATYVGVQFEYNWIQSLVVRFGNDREYTASYENHDNTVITLPKLS